MNKPIVLKAGEAITEGHTWGELCWNAGARLGNSDEMTVGRCTIYPGRSNPLHSHPDCSEILHVLKGHISHTMDSGISIELFEGDTITIPSGFPHQAYNVGDTDAVLMISFSSANRKTVGE